MTRRDPVELLDEAIRHDPSVLMQVMRPQPEESVPPLLTRLTVADVQTNPPPPPSYAWEGLVPNGHVSLLSAHGGVGKPRRSTRADRREGGRAAPGTALASLPARARHRPRHRMHAWPS